jgi:allophanate hydrolase
LTTLARLYQEGAVLPEQILSEVGRRIADCRDPSVWIYRVPPEELKAQARNLEQQRSCGGVLPLYGIPFAVKDNIDVHGCPTTAACPAFAYTPARTAPVVKRLQNAGAILVGKTNLDQFAAGLAGDRSPHGACRNVFHPEHISGGSSSGSAVAVALGLVSFALGTDTAGSGRVPAGCNNIVGMKPTPDLLETDGIVPACQSLDCVSIFALTVHDARQVGEVAAGQPWDGADAPINHAFTFATLREEQWEFFGDTDQAALFAGCLEKLGQMGGRRVELDYRPLREVGSLLYEGPWLAERLAALEPFFKTHSAEIHLVTRAVVSAGARYTAGDVFKAQALLKKMRVTCERMFDDADVLVVPTMPTVPTLAEVKQNSAEWSRRLGYYTNFVNLLGWAALAVPAGFTRNGFPGGITLIGPGSSESRLCRLGQAWQEHVPLPLGATGFSLPRPNETAPAKTRASGWVRVAVAGAHLRGQPLHPDLLRMGARFIRACRTAAHYRFVALMHLAPPRPGLIRDDRRAGSLALEVFELPYEGFGKLVASVAPPLAIGTVELEDGERIKGFLCESWAAAVARDITDFGSWSAFLNHEAVVKHGKDRV